MIRAFLVMMAVAAVGVASSAQAAPLPAYDSPVLYDGVAKTSQYITSYDGTRLAVSIYRPTKNGQPTQDRLPVIMIQQRGESPQIKYFV